MSQSGHHHCAGRHYCAGHHHPIIIHPNPAEPHQKKCQTVTRLSAKISCNALPLDEEAMFDAASSLLTAACVHLEPFISFPVTV